MIRRFAPRHRRRPRATPLGRSSVGRPSRGRREVVELFKGSSRRGTCTKNMRTLGRNQDRLRRLSSGTQAAPRKSEGRYTTPPKLTGRSDSFLRHLAVVRISSISGHHSGRAHFRFVSKAALVMSSDRFIDIVCKRPIGGCLSQRSNQMIAADKLFVGSIGTL